MGDRCGMSISADSHSGETLNRGPLALLLRRQYEFPFGINIPGTYRLPCYLTEGISLTILDDNADY